jgi:hypothetical protein
MYPCGFVLIFGYKRETEDHFGVGMSYFGVGGAQFFICGLDPLFISETDVSFIQC